MSTGDGTRCVHLGQPAPAEGEPFLPGPVFASVYHLHPEGKRAGFDGYGRADNPTVRRLEEAIGELEGGDCVAFGSGMAALSGVLTDRLRPGDTVRLPSDGYYAARRFADTVLAPRGIAVRYTPTADSASDLDGVAVALVETPANPGLDMCDLRAVADAAHAAGALLVVDDTTATPLGLRPLEHGADLVVASGTKALTGHSDLMLGYVAGTDPELMAAVRAWRGLTGALVGPFEAWLAHRSIGTADLRLARQECNAAAVAELLASRPEVTALRWPGRPGDPAYALARRTLRRVPGVVSFRLGSAGRVARMLAAAELVAATTSFGGLHTTADRRAQWGDDVPADLVRLSCGCEDTADLVADLARALDAAAG